MSDAAPPFGHPDFACCGATELDLFSFTEDAILCEVHDDFARLLGRSAAGINGLSLLQLAHPQDTPAVAAALFTLQDGAPEVMLESRFIARDDHSVYVRWAARSVPGTALWSASGQDTTRFHSLIAQISELQARLDLVVGHGTASMWGLEVRQGRLTWDDQAAQILGLAGGAAPGTVAELAALVHEEDSDPVFAALAHLVASGEFELEVSTGQGADVRQLLLRGKVVERDHRDRPLRAVGLALDITAEKAMDEKMERRAMNDALTGMPNRRAFDEGLLNEERRCARASEPLSVIMIDIDDFKGFNDRFGHLAGDAALAAVARALNEALQRAGDLVARFGGEEFAAVLPKTDSRGAHAVGERFVQSVRAIIIPETEDWKLSVSVGIASWHPGNAKLDRVALLDQADHALYEAKAAGKNQAVTYVAR